MLLTWDSVWMPWGTSSFMQLAHWPGYLRRARRMLTILRRALQAPQRVPTRLTLLSPHGSHHCLVSALAVGCQLAGHQACGRHMEHANDLTNGCLRWSWCRQHSWLPYTKRLKLHRAWMLQHCQSPDMMLCDIGNESGGMNAWMPCALSTTFTLRAERPPGGGGGGGGQSFCAASSSDTYQYLMCKTLGHDSHCNLPTNECNRITEQAIVHSLLQLYGVNLTPSEDRQDL